MSELVDLAADLQRLAVLGAKPEQLETMMAHALDSLAKIIPYDLASIFRLVDDDRLKIHLARGQLASTQVKEHDLSLRQLPAVQRSLAQRRPIALTEHQHEEEGDPYDGVLDLPPGHACMVVPLFANDRSLGVMTFDRSVCEPYPPGTVELAGAFGQFVGLAMLLAEQARLLEQQRQMLVDHNRQLKAEFHGETPAIEKLQLTTSSVMQDLIKQAQAIGPADAPALILGETGVGKEVVAQALHDWSPRNTGPFVKINCAALPENLVESELFGHVAGAYSGARGKRSGRFVTANGGTLLLDEIGEVPLGMQAKLLRVLQEGTFEPVGSDKTVKVDVRIVAATHVDLKRAVAEGTFREDLYYRLAVLPLRVPSLHERGDDVLVVAKSLLSERSKQRGRGPWTLSDVAIAKLRKHHWPGNIRELINVLERATILEPPGALQLTDFHPTKADSPDDSDYTSQPLAPASSLTPPSTLTTDTAESLRPLKQIEHDYIEQALRLTHGKIYGPGGAAQWLDLHPATLQSKMRKLGIDRKSLVSTPNS